jgi:hypothetical protein
MSAAVRYPVTLDLSEGSRLVLDGDEWEVTCFQPHMGRVRLQLTTGARRGLEQDVTVRALLNHRDCRPSRTRKDCQSPAGAVSRQAPGIRIDVDGKVTKVAAELPCPE